MSDLRYDDDVYRAQAGHVRNRVQCRRDVACQFTAQKQEKPMTTNLPNTDSIKELASFWDTHDLTDFDDQLQEVTEMVFERQDTVLRVPLTSEQAA